jgi:hypothetical protein
VISVPSWQVASSTSRVCFGMLDTQVFQVMCRMGRRLYLFTLRFLVLEDDAGFLHELFSPFRDLLGRYLVLLGQVAQCLTFLHCVQYDLGLERGIILAFPSHFFHFFTKISLSRHLCFCLNSGEHYIHQLHFHIYHFPLLVSFHYLSTIL